MEKSCEVRYYRNILHDLIFLSPFIYFLAFLFLFIPGEEGLSIFIFILIVISIIYFPFIIYYLIKLNYYKKLKPHYVQEVKLMKVSGSFRSLARFVIEMDLNEKKIVKTLPIFSFHKGRGRPANPIEDYSCKKALVGYDVKNSTAIVLEVLD